MTQPSRILYVGDNRPRKGLAEFLEAAALVYQQLPSLEMVIVSKEPTTIVTTVPYQLHIYPADDKLTRSIGIVTSLFLALGAKAWGIRRWKQWPVAHR